MREILRKLFTSNQCRNLKTIAVEEIDWFSFNNLPSTPDDGEVPWVRRSELRYLQGKCHHFVRQRPSPLPLNPPTATRPLLPKFN